MNFSRKLICLCATVLTAVLSVGCTQSNDKDDPDDPGFEEGVPTEVRITLSARSGNGTRADRDGDDKDPTSSIELIHDDWWIVFIDQNDSVILVTRDDVTDKIQSTPNTVADSKSGFEAETFRIIIPSGEYRIYAFANIPLKTYEEFKKLLKHDSKGEYKLIDKYLSDFIKDGGFRGNTNPNNDKMQWPETIKNDQEEVIDNNIPMTAIITRTIRNTVEEAFNIEVVRAVAKVEFAFTKPANEEITLKELQFSPITNHDKISIVPNYSAVGYKLNDKLIKDGLATGTLSFSNPSLMPTEKYNMGVFGFYCKESLPAENGGPFTIKLKVNKGSEEKEYTQTTTKITYINRNDWIFIPIKFNNWVIKWKLHFYPPIGGYPPVFSQKEDGSSMAATLTTGGEFELYPVEVSQNGILYTVDMKSDDMDAQVTSGSELFIKDANGKDIKVVDNQNQGVTGHPLSAFNKIITGELDPKKTGTAEVEIKFYLTDENITDELTCIFTITRKNSAP